MILSTIWLRPGSFIRADTLSAARTDLRNRGLFKVNPWQDTTPTIAVIPSEFDWFYRDILIRVEEKPGNWPIFRLTELLEAAVKVDMDGFVRTLHRLERTANPVSR